MILGFAKLPLTRNQGLEIQIRKDLRKGNLIRLEVTNAPEGGVGRGISTATASERRVSTTSGVSGSVTKGGLGRSPRGLCLWGRDRCAIQKSLAIVPLPCGLCPHQPIHKVQIGKGILAVDHLTVVGGAAILVDKFGCGGRPPRITGTVMPRSLKTSRFSFIKAVDFTKRPLMAMQSA